MHPLPLLTPHDNPGIAQNLHVVGQGRLTDAHFLQQLAGAFFPAAEQFQNLQPVFIAEGLEYPGGFLIWGCHVSRLTFNNFDMSIVYAMH